MTTLFDAEGIFPLIIIPREYNKYTPEEVGHNHVHTKSGRVPYIEILYHLQVQAKKPWRQFQRTDCVKIHAK